MALTRTLKLRAVRPPLVQTRPARATRPLFRLRATFWATSCLRNRELWLYADRLELHVPRAGGLVMHRVRLERINRVELIEGRVFSDVVIATDGGAELVAPGIRNRDLAPARAHLARVMTGRHPAARG
jgi:hypothetical protein